jgi:hypothetical protein
MSEQTTESPALAQVLDALRVGRVACEWLGKHPDGDRIAAAMDAARLLEHKASRWDAINLLWSFPGKTLEQVLEMRMAELALGKE